MSIKSDREENDEIHLGLLLLGLKKIIVKKWAIISLSIALGLTAGGILFIIQKPIFETNMIVHSYYIDYDHAKILSENIKALIEKGEYKNISENFSISLESAKNLKSFKIESSGESNLEKNQTNRLLKITVKVRDNEILPKLQKGILNYLQNSPYVLKNLDVRKTTIAGLIERFTEEIEKLNNINMKKPLGLKSSTGIVFFNPENVNAVRVNLIEKKVEQEQELKLIEGISLVNGFTIFENSSNLSLVKMTTISGGIGLVIAFIIVMIGEFNAYLKKLEEETENS